MISLATPERSWGTAFGFHRTLDATGALIGPLIAFAILWVLPGSFDSIFLLSVGFGLLGFAVIMTWVRNPTIHEPKQASSDKLRDSILAHVKNDAFRRILLVGVMFGVFSIGDAFVYLAILDAARSSSEIGTGVGAQWFPLLFAGTAVAFLLTATPLGRLADRVGRARVWVVGQLLLAGVYFALIFEPTSVLAIGGVLVMLGIYYGATDGVLPALAAGVIPESLRSSGLALLSTAVALARGASALSFGLIWERIGVDRALALVCGGLVFSIIAITFTALVREDLSETKR